MTRTILKILRRIHPLVWVGLVLLTGWFYWFEWRPTAIKKVCNTQAEGKAEDLVRKKYEIAKDYTPQKDSYYRIMNKRLFLMDDYEEYYKSCLRERGL
jgi:hypothetical protein